MSQSSEQRADLEEQVLHHARTSGATAAAQPARVRAQRLRDALAKTSAPLRRALVFTNSEDARSPLIVQLGSGPGAQMVSVPPKPRERTAKPNVGPEQAQQTRDVEDKLISSVADALEARVRMKDLSEVPGLPGSALAHDAVDLATRTLRDALHLNVRFQRAMVDLVQRMAEPLDGDDGTPPPTRHQVERPIEVHWPDPSRPAQGVFNVRNDRGVWLRLEFPREVSLRLQHDGQPAELAEETFTLNAQPQSLRLRPGDSQDVLVGIKLPLGDGGQLRVLPAGRWAGDVQVQQVGVGVVRIPLVLTIEVSLY